MVVKHRISRVRLVPRGYDLIDGKLVINEREAAIVRMLFERYAKLDSAPALKRKLAAPKTELAALAELAALLRKLTAPLLRKLRAEGIADERGEPIDKAYLYRLLNNHVYVMGEKAHKNVYSGAEAIIDWALWRKVHRISRVLRSDAARKGRKNGQ